jgi:methionyl-tRNA formyltransferase
MDMVKEMDAGDFYQQYKIEIEEDDNYDIMYSKLSSLIEETAAKSIKEIDEGYPATKQDESKVSK